MKALQPQYYGVWMLSSYTFNLWGFEDPKNFFKEKSTYDSGFSPSHFLGYSYPKHFNFRWCAVFKMCPEVL